MFLMKSRKDRALILELFIALESFDRSKKNLNNKKTNAKDSLEL